eukprot:2295-Pyramimonas_sp.AAC.1
MGPYAQTQRTTSSGSQHTPAETNFGPHPKLTTAVLAAHPDHWRRRRPRTRGASRGSCTTDGTGNAVWGDGEAAFVQVVLLI